MYTANTIATTKMFFFKYNYSLGEEKIKYKMSD